MDETTFVRELRAGAPLPDRARLAPGRQRLLDAAASGGRVRTLRSDWRTAAVGAVAAITVAAVSVTLLVGGGDRDEAPASLLSGVSGVGSAKSVLLDAAAMVEDDPVPRPGAKQWIYSRESIYNVTFDENSGVVVGDDGGKAGRPPGPDGGVTLTGPGPHEVEEWIPFGNPAAEKGKTDDDYSAREIFARLADLPDDRGKVLDKVLKFYPTGSDHPETPEEHAFRALGLMATEQPIAHPQGLAKVYRAMAEIPGIKASRVTDTAGRETVAISRRDGAGAGSDIRMYLLDPATGLTVGQRWEASQDGPTAMFLPESGGKAVEVPAKTKWKKGDVVMEDLVLEAALVDKDRERS
ncbi:CU044_5270 family protein [Streptomyces sp. NPDC059943]|uniref:CU044_5270 family protein n=1 Tax=Streptomyces sp. NPDC059943 TaxID=3347010 RepID=UPI00366425E6